MMDNFVPASLVWRLILGGAVIILGIAVGDGWGWAIGVVGALVIISGVRRSVTDKAVSESARQFKQAMQMNTELLERQKQVIRNARPQADETIDDVKKRGREQFRKLYRIKERVNRFCYLDDDDVDDPNDPQLVADQRQIIRDWHEYLSDMKGSTDFDELEAIGGGRDTRQRLLTELQYFEDQYGLGPIDDGEGEEGDAD